MKHKQEILNLRAEGKTYTEISQILKCAKSTISFHCGSKLIAQKYLCIQCGCKLKRGKSSITKLCKDCRDVWFSLQNKGQVFADRKNWQSARSGIRKHARETYLKVFPNPVCKHCGYDKYVEVCHIKAVADFIDSALVKEINDISNLVGLCPNHHWEFDNGLLVL